ncbi:hypothetical protein J6590_019111 [Homalodisca vitripennis]|nr:hypothetical protein J6590_019111 [Homalodisca vitripennis]
MSVVTYLVANYHTCQSVSVAVDRACPKDDGIPPQDIQIACRKRFGKLTGTTHQLQLMSCIAVRYGLAKLQETSIWETHWNNTPAPADELQYAMAWRNCRKLRFGKLTGTTHQLQRMSCIAVRYGLAKLQETSIWETHWNNTPAPADELQYAMAWRNCRKLRFGKLTGTTHQLQRMSCSTLWLGETAMYF